MIQKARAYTRIILAILSLAYFLSRLLIINLFKGSNVKRGFIYRQKYIRSAMAILGLQIEYKGEIPNETCLMVSNHRSMVDPLILLRNVDAYIVSKAEVEKYPLIGRGAKETGIIYVKRGDRSSRLATRDAIRDALISGKSIMLFPEGTTSNGPGTIDFKLGSFNVAADIGVPVVPFVLDYENQKDYWVNAPLLMHFAKVFGRKTIRGKIWIGPKIEGDSGLFLMKESKKWIDETMPEMYGNH